MQLSTYVEALQRQLMSTAAAGTAETEEIAGRFVVALDASARVAILDALSDAAGEITRDLAPGSVDVRLRGRDVEFAVTPATAPAPGAGPVAPTGPVHAQQGGEAGEDSDDAATSRTTLRLPDALKSRAEAAAANEGVSLNTWLVRAITTALDPARSCASSRGRPSRDGSAERLRRRRCRSRPRRHPDGSRRSGRDGAR